MFYEVSCKDFWSDLHDLTQILTAKHLHPHRAEEPWASSGLQGYADITKAHPWYLGKSSTSDVKRKVLWASAVCSTYCKPTACSWLSPENLQCRLKSGPDCIRKINLNKAELLVIKIIKLDTDEMVVEDRTIRTWGWIVRKYNNISIHSWMETVGLFWIRTF